MQAFGRELHTVSDSIHWIYHSYNQAKSFVQGQYDRDVRHPEWTKLLLDKLSHPDYAACNVAVTGSKGKGSNSILLAGMLQTLGLSVGLFTGPHLVDFLERCRVNGQAISESDFVEYMRIVKSCADSIALPERHYFGPVGLLAALAARWFRDKGTEVNVFELGRGALHDDVNQVRHSGAVLTPVFLEHADKLGPTLSDVVREKIGVATVDTKWLCSHKQQGEVSRALQDVKGHVDVRVCEDAFGQDVRIQGNTVAVPYDEATYTITLPHVDGYVVSNTVVALDAARMVWRQLRPGVPMSTVFDLSKLRLPGRLEVLSESPRTVVDGAIHALSAEHVAEWIRRKKQQRAARKTTAILSLPTDKDGQGVVTQLAPHVDSIIFTKASNPHLTFTDEFAAFAEKLVKRVAYANDIGEALRISEWGHCDDDLFALVGTQSFVGDVLRHFARDTLSIWND